MQKIISFLTCCFLCFTISAQTALKEATLNNSVDGVPITVKFKYYNDEDGKRIRTGDVIGKKAPDTRYSNYSYSFKASYKDYILDGPITAKLTGKEVSFLKGAFHEGNYNGPWTVQNGYRIITATFNDNALIGDFEILDPNLSVVGKYDENGKFDGVWKTQYIAKQMSYEFIHGILVDLHTRDYDMPQTLRKMSVDYANGNVSKQELEAGSYAVIENKMEDIHLDLLINGLVQKSPVPWSVLDVELPEIAPTQSYLRIEKVPYFTDSGLKWLIAQVEEGNDIDIDEDQYGNYYTIVYNYPNDFFNESYVTVVPEKSYDGIRFFLTSAQIEKFRKHFEKVLVESKNKLAESFSYFFMLQKNMSQSRGLLDILTPISETIINDYKNHYSAYNNLFAFNSYSQESYVRACKKLYPIIEYEYIPESPNYTEGNEMQTLLFEVRSRNKDNGQGITTYHIPVYYTSAGIDFDKTFCDSNMKIVHSRKDDLYDSMRELDKVTSKISENTIGGCSDVVEVWNHYISASQSDFTSKGVEVNLKNVQNSIDLGNKCLKFIAERKEIDVQSKDLIRTVSSYKNLKKALKNTYKNANKRWNSDYEIAFERLRKIEELFDQVKETLQNGKVQQLDSKLAGVQNLSIEKFLALISEIE